MARCLSRVGKLYFRKELQCLSHRPICSGSIASLRLNNIVNDNNFLHKRCYVKDAQGHHFPGILYGKTEPKVSQFTDEQLAERIIKTCQNHERVSADKVTMESHFMKDLGLDSLDHVEIIMAIEEEFHLHIPDDDAERLLTPGDIAQYIRDKEDLYD